MILTIALITWYITKLYYTRSFRLHMAKSELIELKCSHCGKPIYRVADNIRVYNYCTDCL
jgi:formamidopyrimidine-DNA glycosylase